MGAPPSGGGRGERGGRPHEPAETSPLGLDGGGTPSQRSVPRLLVGSSSEDGHHGESQQCDQDDKGNQDLKRARPEACSICGGDGGDGTLVEHCSSCMQLVCDTCVRGCSECGEPLCDDGECCTTCNSANLFEDVGCGAVLCFNCVWVRRCGRTIQLCGECDAIYECPDCDACASEPADTRSVLGSRSQPQ